MTAFYEHWLALEHEKRIETIKRMAQEGMGANTIARATSVNVRLVRRVLAENPTMRDQVLPIGRPEPERVSTQDHPFAAGGRPAGPWGEEPRSAFFYRPAARSAHAGPLPGTTLRAVNTADTVGCE